MVLHKEGYSFRQIAEKIGGGATCSGVFKVCKKFGETGTLKDRKRSGRRRISSEREDRTLVRLATADRHKNAKCLSRKWSVRASKCTILRRLKKAGIMARKPRRKPLLNVAQRQKRLQWAKEHVHWSIDKWRTVIWSDETKINLFGNDAKAHHVWRRNGEAYSPSCMLPTVKHSVSIMVWGCMCASGVGRMCILNGTVNGAKYLNEVLEKRLIPSIRDLSPSLPDGTRSFIFQQDNAPCHTSKLCTKWFIVHSIKVLDWPGNSPDLNPIEHLWRRLKTLVEDKKPSNKTELIEATIESWHHVIRPEELQSLVFSMPRRCRAVVAARGYPTKY